MLASTSAEKVAAWARSRYADVWYVPKNGAGLLREPPGHPEYLVPNQLPPSGTFPPLFVVSSGWNDLVVGGYEPEDVSAAADQLLATLAAEGVECVAWLLNRDQAGYFVFPQKWSWIRGNQHLSPRSRRPPAGADVQRGHGRPRTVQPAPPRRSRRSRSPARSTSSSSSGVSSPSRPPGSSRSQPGSARRCPSGGRRCSTMGRPGRTRRSRPRTTTTTSCIRVRWGLLRVPTSRPR